MLNPRLDALVDYPFARLRRLLGADTPPPGLEPMVLSVGEPRHPAPPWIDAIIAEHAAAWNRYPPVDGTPAFRRAVAGWLSRRYRLATGFLDPDRHLLPVSGTREALFLAASLAVPDRKAGATPAVLMPNPFYQVYFGAAVIAGAEPVCLPATADRGFLFDLDAVDTALLARTALIFLCSPGNPHGAVAGRRHFEQAIAVARRYDAVLAVDECYADIYDRDPPMGCLEAASAGGSLSGILVFHSLSKRSSVPGLRSGFVAGDADLIDGFKRLRSYGGATVPLPILAASAALWSDDTHADANRAQYRAKIDLAESLLAGRFGFFRPAGGFFLWLNVGDGEDAARRLWREAAVRVLPGRYLARSDSSGDNPGRAFIRVALVDDLTRTEEALRRIVDVL